MPDQGESEGSGISKSKAKKDAKKAQKAEKAAQRQQQSRAAPATATATAGGAESNEPDPLASNYGDRHVEDIRSKSVTGRTRTSVEVLCAEMKDKSVWIRGAAQVIRPVSKKMAFLVVRQVMSTVQCVVVVKEGLVSPQIVRFATSLSKESFVHVEGVISVPNDPIKGTTQQVEIQVRKLYCINRALPNLPFNIEDASCSEAEFQKAEERGEQLVRVGQDTRLNNRALDLRTFANQAIFCIQSEVKTAFRQFMLSECFRDISSPKIVAGSSEGGAAVFKLDYKGQPACLAQSPQLYKQMTMCGGFPGVFEVGPVFRAEDSYTHRHLCEFVGLDCEMEIEEDYFELIDCLWQSLTT